MNHLPTFDSSAPVPIPAQPRVRPLYEIAAEIRREWKNVNYAAKPYLDAMSSLYNISDSYGYDSARSVVLYFLANAGAFRGEAAKRLKAELKALSGK